VKDFQFVDAVSGAPLSRENRDDAPPSGRRIRRSNLKILFLALIVLIIWLATWVFS
jgi:hypothetical protein